MKELLKYLETAEQHLIKTRENLTHANNINQHADLELRTQFTNLKSGKDSLEKSLLKEKNKLIETLVFMITKVHSEFPITIEIHPYRLRIYSDGKVLGGLIIGTSDEKFKRDYELRSEISEHLKLFGDYLRNDDFYKKLLSIITKGLKNYPSEIEKLTHSKGDIAKVSEIFDEISKSLPLS